MERSSLKHDYRYVTVKDQGEIVAIEAVKKDFRERRGSKITVGYAPANIESVVRIVPVVTWGQVAYSSR